MTLREVITRLDRYFESDDNRPRLVNFQNQESLKSFRHHYDTGKFQFKSPEDYSGQDEDIRLEDLYVDLPRLTGVVFLTGFSSQLKLYGARELEHFLVTMAGLSLSNCKLVVLCYQCEDALKFGDQRLKKVVYSIEGSSEQKKRFCFIRTDLSASSDGSMIDGFQHIGTAVETMPDTLLMVRTRKKAAAYQRAVYAIEEIADAYDALCQQAPDTCSLKKAYGTDEQWLYALKEVSSADGWEKAIAEYFGSTLALDIAANSWENFSPQMQWLYFIALKLFGAGKNGCLQKAVQAADNVAQLIKNVYRGILGEPWKDPAFEEKYRVWKLLRKNMFDLPDDQQVLDYVAMVRQYGKDALYYLTDLTKIERETIINLISQYADAYTDVELCKALSVVYPDLAAYLNPFTFQQNEWLDAYFQEYRFSKVRNHISDALRGMAEDQAVKRDFYKLPPRISRFCSIPQKDAFLYFMDAMGVEFVPYIIQKCKEYGLSAKVTICHCELPSLTRTNKDFWEAFDQNSRIKVTELDEIKHKGKENYDYQITKTPLHLIREMEIIDEVLRQARTRLSGDRDKVILCSDHGATRMAVINEHILNIDANAKGTNGGRVCAYSEDMEQIAAATQEGEYYVLASYDRFKGGKPASVEAHGGATLEEVVVPIIELTVKGMTIEISVITPVVEYSFKQQPVLKLFSKTMLSNVRLLVNQQWYQPEPDSDGHTFSFVLSGLKRGEYIASVYTSEGEAASGLSFTLKSKVGGISNKGGIL